MTKLLTIQVAYSDASQVYLEQFSLAPPCTVADALTLAKQTPDFPGDEVMAHCSLAIFGRAATRETPLNDQDRVEVLRPLQRDPKEHRLQKQRKKPR